ncbi:MAG: hypothetical protein KF803_14575 [Cyclobacteriaceae bacterium]|nr:hypothetical protein [Cyclobacteriaceae bacterium]
MKQLKFVISIGMFLLSLLLITCDTKNNVEPTFRNYFIRYYGEDGNHEAKDFVLTNDGGVIIIGTVTVGQSQRLYALKTDLAGNQLWSKTFGSVTNERAQDIEPIIYGTDAGNFAILSNFVKPAVDSLAMRLTLISTNGDSLKSFTVNIFESQEGSSVTPLQNGDYLIAGKVSNADTLNVELPGVIDREDLLTVRINANLSSVTEFDRLGRSSEGSNVKIFEAGNYLYTIGYSNESIAGTPAAVEDGPNFFFRSLGPLPTPDLVIDYAGTASERQVLRSVSRTSSGLLFAVGDQTDLSDNIASSRVFAARAVGTIASVDRSRTIFGSTAQAVAIVSSGSFDQLVILNSIQSSGQRDIVLLKINIELNEVLRITFGAVNNDDRGAAVAELPNGDILILGTMELAGQQDKIALIKVRANGTF